MDRREKIKEKRKQAEQGKKTSKVRWRHLEEN